MANQINITTQDGNSVVVNTTDNNIIEIITAGPQGPKGDIGGGTNNIDTGSLATTGSNSFIGNQTITGSVDITGSLTVNTINVGLNTINFIDTNGNVINSLAIPSGSKNITISTGSIQSVGEAYFSGSFTGSLFGTASLAFDIINKPFLFNKTIPNGNNVISVNQNIFNHGDLLVQSEDTLIVEEGAKYFILGDLTNSGSVIVSGSLIVHGIIHNIGSIVGPGPVLSNNVLVTYDKANVPYGFTQLDGGSNLSISGSLNVNVGITGSLYDEAFSKNRTTNNSINFIKQYQSIFNPSNLFIPENDIFIVEENGEYYVLGDVINSGSIVVNGTFKIGGILLNYGTITGTGIIE